MIYLMNYAITLHHSSFSNRCGILLFQYALPVPWGSILSCTSSYYGIILTFSTQMNTWTCLCATWILLVSLEVFIIPFGQMWLINQLLTCVHLLKSMLCNVIWTHACLWVNVTVYAVYVHVKLHKFTMSHLNAFGAWISK